MPGIKSHWSCKLSLATPDVCECFQRGAPLRSECRDCDQDLLNLPGHTHGFCRLNLVIRSTWDLGIVMESRGQHILCGRDSIAKLPDHPPKARVLLHPRFSSAFRLMSLTEKHLNGPPHHFIFRQARFQADLYAVSACIDGTHACRRK